MIFGPGFSILIGLLILAGCHEQREPAADVLIEHEVLPQPPQVGDSTIALKLMNADGIPITGARIRLQGIMTHPGMRPIFSEAQEAGSGRYQASLSFMMAGDWIVLLQVTLPDGQKLERQFFVKGVLPD